MGDMERRRRLQTAEAEWDGDDEDTLQTNSDAREVTKYQTFGANYLLNVNYRFK